MKLKRNSRPSDVNQAAYQMVRRSTRDDEPTEVLIIGLGYIARTATAQKRLHANAPMLAMFGCG
jgi:hypothetical protein